MALGDELEQIAEQRAGAMRRTAEELVVVIPAEPVDGTRVYLCAFSSGDDSRTWLALDGAGEAIADRALVHEAVTVAALCELAEESAAGGDVDGFEARLAELAQAEGPSSWQTPRPRSPSFAPSSTATSRRFSRLPRPHRACHPALRAGAGRDRLVTVRRGDEAGSDAVEGLAAEVEASYKIPLG